MRTNWESLIPATRGILASGAPMPSTDASGSPESLVAFLGVYLYESSDGMLYFTFSPTAPNPGAYWSWMIKVSE